MVLCEHCLVFYVFWGCVFCFICVFYLCVCGCFVGWFVLCFLCMKFVLCIFCWCMFWHGAVTQVGAKNDYSFLNDLPDYVEEGETEVQAPTASIPPIKAITPPHKPDPKRLEEFHAYILRSKTDDPEIKSTLERNPDLASKFDRYEYGQPEDHKSTYKAEIAQYITQELYGLEDGSEPSSYFIRRNKPIPSSPTKSDAWAAVYDDYAQDVERNYLLVKGLFAAYVANEAIVVGTMVFIMDQIEAARELEGARRVDISAELLSCGVFVCVFLFLFCFAVRRRRRLGMGDVLLFFARGSAAGCVIGLYTILKKVGFDVEVLIVPFVAFLAWLGTGWVFRLFVRVPKLAADGSVVVRRAFFSRGWVQWGLIPCVLMFVSPFLVLMLNEVCGGGGMRNGDFWMMVYIGGACWFVFRFVYDAFSKAVLAYRKDNPLKALLYFIICGGCVVLWVCSIVALRGLWK